jgi:hypothetical protein
MTTRGTRLAMLFGLVLAFLLPKHVECGYPDASCGRVQQYGRYRELCQSYEVEPWGFYMIELVVHRDVGFAYSSDEDCR